MPTTSLPSSRSGPGRGPGRRTHPAGGRRPSRRGNAWRLPGGRTFGTWCVRSGPGSGHGSGRSSVFGWCSLVFPLRWACGRAALARGRWDWVLRELPVQALVGDARGRPDAALAAARVVGRDYCTVEPCLRLGHKSASLGKPLQQSLLRDALGRPGQDNLLRLVAEQPEGLRRCGHAGALGAGRPPAGGRCPAKRRSRPGRTSRTFAISGTGPSSRRRGVARGARSPEVLGQLLDVEQTGKCFGVGHRCLLWLPLWLPQ